MIETEPIVWELPRLQKPFQCFTKGCTKQAEFVAKIWQGEAVFQVCLCSECRRKSLGSIVRDLTKGSDKMVHQTAVY